MKNWKTTTIGILLIVSTISTDLLNWFQHGKLPDFATSLTAVGAGVGMLVAKDFNITGTGKGSVAGGNVDNSINATTTVKK